MLALVLSEPGGKIKIQSASAGNLFAGKASLLPRLLRLRLPLNAGALRTTLCEGLEGGSSGGSSIYIPKLVLWESKRYMVEG